MVRFKQAHLNEAFQRDGFVTFPLLNQEQVEKLKTFYHVNKQRHLTSQPVLHSTSDTANYELIKNVDTFIQGVITKAVDTVMEDYEPLIATYLTKEPGDASETGFHQDPTLVEEPQYVSGNIWIALQDTGSHNGNLRMVKGSHRITNNVRATPDCPLFFQNFKDTLLEYSTEVPLKAGEAVFLSHSTVHGASSNNTGEERIAAVMAIKSKPAPWIFYYWHPGTPVDKVEKYSISPEAFSRLVKNQRPTHGKLLGYVRPEFKLVTKEHFESFMRGENGKGSLISRIKDFLPAAMDKRVPLFVDSQAQEEFNRKGYTKLSLLDDTQVRLLREAYALYEKEHLDVKLPFISTSHSNNARLIASVDRSILEVAESAIHKHITNAQVLFSNFLVKRTGADTATGPHQDTTFVDESEACSYSLWIALEDVSVHNGCMKVLERSHLFPRYIRSNPLKHWRYRGIIERMEKDMLPVPLKKGEALVFPHSLIHSSFPNLSSVNRLAAVVACYTPGAQLWHYETNKKNEAVVEQYAMTKDAFLAYVKGAAPQLGKLVAEFPIETSPINKITYYYFRLNARLNRQSAV